ncbi:MAG: class I SAM-dependent methyltransferase [Deltaproteobacteria bacterium]|nr:class I SAM-dependent methyltransferase [Deltaproteobacteria bacterium]
MNTELLLRHLTSIDRSKDSAWAERLAPRKREELEFHDARVDRTVDGANDEGLASSSNKRYYRYVDAARRYCDDWIRTNAPGKVFLDYACGTGEAARKAAACGASLSIGIDISGASIDTARALAEKEGFSERSSFIQGDCEKTELPASSVDLVLCSGMLHHLDLSYAFPELRRILKPGGKILAFEALNYNPLIRLYRKLTPSLRTNWEKEHILGLSDLRFAERFFTRGEVRYWNILSILSPHLPLLAPALAAADSVLTKIPLVQLMAWIFTFELIKEPGKK